MYALLVTYGTVGVGVGVLLYGTATGYTTHSVHPLKRRLQSPCCFLFSLFSLSVSLSHSDINRVRCWF